MASSLIMSQQLAPLSDYVGEAALRNSASGMSRPPTSLLIAEQLQPYGICAQAHQQKYGCLLGAGYLKRIRQQLHSDFVQVNICKQWV